MKRACFLILVVACCLACRTPSRAEKESAAGVREPAVAGRFYPGDAASLRRAVEKFAQDAVPPRCGRPVAVVAPHAGYVFSGQIAADAYRPAQGHDYDLFVILGTNHTTPTFRGVAVYSGSGFRTPLGVAEVDRKAAESLIAADPGCAFRDDPHAKEHSVEVQVPFIQALFPGAKILPLVVGEPDPELCDRLGKALGTVLRGRKALVVASTDLSHYPSAKDAMAVDRKVLEVVARLDPVAFRATIASEMSRGVPGLSTCACGEGPVLAVISAAKALGATRGIVASYANSGDVPVGEPGRVVGYGAVVFADGPPHEIPSPGGKTGGADTGALHPTAEPSPGGPLEPADKKALLAFARETIHRYLTTGTLPLVRGFSTRAQRPRGAFVTLTKGGELRGCIGNMLPGAPLDRTVGAMALRAAFEDPRFPPVTLEEYPRLSIEISALTPLKAVSSADDIVVGRDGVLLEKDGRSAVFLPQVATEQGWGRDEMLDHLCRKAGLPAGSWKQGARFSVFQAEVFGERDGK